MIRQRFKAILHKLVEKQRCPQRLSRSFCLGAYIAFSPFIGFHTLLVFTCAWLLSLDIAAMFAATWLINNPWTMIPVYALDYNVGHLVLRTVCGPEVIALNPNWAQSASEFLGKCFGTNGLSVWAFIVGGNLIGLSVAVMLYPVMKRFFTQLIKEKKHYPSVSNEGHSPEQKSIF